MTNETAARGLSLVERYNQMRSQIEHEDNLVTQRLNWFLTSQSFLFTAYAIVFNGMPAATNENLATRALLLRVIPAIAIIAGVLIVIAIFGGVLVMRKLRVGFLPYRDQAAANLPPLQGSSLTLAMGTLAPTVLPLVFVFVWAMLIMRG
jgi:hypothetical protein